MTAYQSTMPSGMPIKGTRIHRTTDEDTTLCGKKIGDDWQIAPNWYSVNCKKCRAMSRLAVQSNLQGVLMAKSVSKIPPALTKELAVVNGLVAKLPKKITSDKEYAFVEETNKQANAFVKKVKAAKDAIEKPLKEAIKALKAEYEPLLAPAEAVLEATKPLIAAWAFAKEQEAEKERLREQRELDKQAEAQRKAEVAALRESGDKAAARVLASASIVAQEAVVESKAARDDLSFRKDVEVDIVDIDLVPPLYVNKSLRLADVKAAWRLDNSVEIPGLKLRETRIVARSS